MITLQIIIRHFDEVVKNIDFAHLPEKESEEYRQLVLKTANDQIFRNGRLSQETEWTLELFDRKDVREVLHDLGAINALTDRERVRFGFYMDLKDVCYPLFRVYDTSTEEPQRLDIDWTQWPWNFEDGETSLDNDELFDKIASGQYRYLSAAMLYYFYRIVWFNDDFYSSVARNEASQYCTHELTRKWNRRDRTEEEEKDLSASINGFANHLWFIENHMKVGRQLGFDFTMQSVYDAMDTFIDRTYRHAQVDFAREFGTWINTHMTIGEEHPAKEKIEAMWAEMQRLMKKYRVSSPSMDYSWNLITMDLLRVGMFDEDEDEDENWNEN